MPLDLHAHRVGHLTVLEVAVQVALLIAHDAKVVLLVAVRVALAVQVEPAELGHELVDMIHLVADGQIAGGFTPPEWDTCNH